MNSTLRPGCLLRQDRQPVERHHREEIARTLDKRASKCGHRVRLYLHPPDEG